jgi:hypothetical protein
MGEKKSPQLLKDKVVGARFTPHEVAALTVLAGGRPLGTWLRELAVTEVRAARKDGRI